MLTTRPPIGDADLGGIAVHNRDDGVATLGEAPVVRQGLTEIAGADDHHRPRLGEPELPAHLEHQILDVVAHAPRAVGAKVGEVLAHLGRVHAGQLREAFRRHGVVAGLAHVEEQSQVDG